MPIQVASTSGPAQTAAPVEAATVSSTSPSPSIAPTIQKLGSLVHFTLNPKAYKHVQKVEFYVENQFVGAAYSTPYTVAVNEDTLTSGTHQVSAKIYTDTSTTNSQSSQFSAAPASTPAPSSDAADSTSTAVIVPSPTTVTPPVPLQLAAPTDINSTASTDGTVATLTWTESDTAVLYQIVRDGTQIATTSGAGYTDTGLNPGQTYDYQIIAVAAGGSTSNPSATTAVTMPIPAPLAPAAATTSQTQPQTQTVPAPPN